MGGLKIKDLVNEGWAVSLVFESSITLSSCFEDERTDVTATLLYRVAETGASLTVGHGDEVGAMQTVAAFERNGFAPDGPLSRRL